MAPACASMDMFANYNKRGEAFADAVRALAAEQRLTGPAAAPYVRRTGYGRLRRGPGPRQQRRARQWRGQRQCRPTRAPPRAAQAAHRRPRRSAGRSPHALLASARPAGPPAPAGLALRGRLAAACRAAARGAALAGATTAPARAPPAQQRCAAAVRAGTPGLGPPADRVLPDPRRRPADHRARPGDGLLRLDDQGAGAGTSPARTSSANSSSPPSSAPDCCWSPPGCPSSSTGRSPTRCSWARSS